MVTDEQVWLDALASNFGELGNFRGVYLFLLFCFQGGYVNFKCHLRVLPRLIRRVLYRCFICLLSAASRTAGQLLIIVNGWQGLRRAPRKEAELGPAK